MNIDKSRISPARFMFAIICYIQGSSLLTSFIVAVTDHDSWIAVLIATVVFLPVIWLYRVLVVRYPNQNLLEMMETVFGKPIGKALGVLYVWFFFTLASLNLYDLGDFTRLTLMEQTPNVVLVILCLIVAAMAVRHGLRAVAWYSSLYMIVSFTIFALTILLVLNSLNFDNFLPMFELPAIKYAQGAHIISTIPFGELVAFLMITPNVNLTPKATTKCMLFGFLIGAATTLLVVARDTAVLGNTMKMFALPSLVTLTLVHLGEALSRVEILFAIILVMLLFIKITFLIYVSVRAIAQVVGAKSIKHLTLIAGAFMVAYGQTLYHDSMEHALSAHEIVPIAWTFFEALIPLVLLIVAMLRKFPQKKEA